MAPMGLPAPYYEDADCVLYHGDCREVLPALPRASADLILTDPPYGDTPLEWDVRLASWLPLVGVLLKSTGSLWAFGSLRSFLSSAAEFSAWRFVQDIVWEKHNGSSFHADRFKRVHEHALQFIPANARWCDIYKAPIYTPDATARTVRRKERPPHMGAIPESTYTAYDGGPRLMRSVIRRASCHGYALHPTQKPVDILTPLIEYSCPPAGLVVDCFAGSGSTGVGAKLVGRRSVLVERDERYCEGAARRLAQQVLPLEWEAAG